MESLGRPAGATEATAAPVRFGTLVFANGVNPYEWWAKGEGDQLQLSRTLRPLQPFRRDITVLNELHVFNNTSGPHWPLFSNMLSGAQFKPTLLPRGAESIDQVIARHTGKLTPVPSLVLAVEPAESGLRGGVPSVYYGTMSWSSPNTPIPPEVYPRAVFDRLFDTSGLLRQHSVLDAVLEQTKTVDRNLSARDHRKLEEFQNSVRELELRIERATSENRLEGWRPSLSEPNMDRPPETLPQDVREHMKMMLDLLLLAWQMDKTRVATLIFNRDVSHMKFGFLDGVLNDQLHGISHHKDDKEKLASYQRINQFHVEQFAYLLSKMSQIDEGNGTTMLDNVILLFGSNMFNGDSHDGRNLPLVLAGHGGVGLPGGRAIDFSSKPEEQQRACNLYLSIAQLMGVSLPSFGDSVGPLDELIWRSRRRGALE
ncbi:DUF1552 domain-containing protein [Roseiconus nitratireducens]|nr:DUF1552 domain-containing protein [Roseiconus nitratireducens]